MKIYFYFNSCFAIYRYLLCICCVNCAYYKLLHEKSTPEISIKLDRNFQNIELGLGHSRKHIVKQTKMAEMSSVEKKVCPCAGAIFGIGNPLLDISAVVDDAYLEKYVYYVLVLVNG